MEDGKFGLPLQPPQLWQGILIPTDRNNDSSRYYPITQEKNMLRKTLLFTLLIVLIAACAPQAAATDSSTALTFTDGLGREIKLDGPAQRVLSMAPSNT